MFSAPPSPSQREEPTLDDALDPLRTAVAMIPLAALAHGPDLQILAANEQCAAMLQVPMHDLLGRKVRDFIPIADQASARKITKDLLRRRVGDSAPPAVSHSALRRVQLDDGSTVTCWMHVGVTPLAGDEVFVVCMDLVNPVLSEAHRWQHRADHDELTGLLRRRPLMESLEESLAAGDRVVFAFSDVDNLKAINDTHGHAAGDHVLAVIGRRLDQFAPAGSLVSRLSGDEFVLARILSPSADEDSSDAVGGLCSAIERSLAEPIAWEDHLLTVSMSTGIAVSRPEEAHDPLFARADAAMYAEKTARRSALLMPSQRRSHDG